MAKIEVQKVPKKKTSVTDAQRTLGTLCYYYPQYTYNEARKLPYKRVVMLLNIAHERQGMHYHHLLSIAVATNAKSRHVSKLSNYFKGMMNG